jgi:hypothetical protein
MSVIASSDLLKCTQQTAVCDADSVLYYIWQILVYFVSVQNTITDLQNTVAGSHASLIIYACSFALRSGSVNLFVVECTGTLRAETMRLYCGSTINTRD